MHLFCHTIPEVDFILNDWLENWNSKKLTVCTILIVKLITTLMIYILCSFLCHHLLFLTPFQPQTDTNFDTKVIKQGKIQSYRCRCLTTAATATITIMMMNHFCIHNFSHKETLITSDYQQMTENSKYATMNHSGILYRAYINQ